MSLGEAVRPTVYGVGRKSLVVKTQYDFSGKSRPLVSPCVGFDHIIGIIRESRVVG